MLSLSDDLVNLLIDAPGAFAQSARINRANVARYDQVDESFVAMLFISSAYYWDQIVHSA
jgi:hypothetical protein